MAIGAITPLSMGVIPGGGRAGLTHNGPMSCLCNRTLHRTLLRWTVPGLLAGGLGLAAEAAPQLQCQVTYAGVTRTVLGDPVADPYPVVSTDIAGRFRFKPVVVGTAQQVERVLIHVAVQTPQQPVPIHQAKYLGPFAAGATPLPLTGEQRLYAGPLERELIYSCALHGVAP